MSCRFCRERLSAYLDSELCDQEKGEVQSHLECCAACQVEYRALRETKQALASLGARVSREEIERLLQTDVGEAVRRYASMPVSPRTVTAAIFSVIALCVATARVATRESRRGAPLPEGAYLLMEPSSSSSNRVFSMFPMHTNSAESVETCVSVPNSNSVMQPAIYCGTLYVTPTPAPVRRAFFFQASFSTR
ncbi:zf-HC2 domain-containing protein [Armatimonas sp.]|uniref:anti-sigma factor family protein n=1 Tax=Armatimonas sp. TaxID=1872638 RepID=UPI00286D38F9|nr:zf-HC2 domain-containing protein [Armatimonas sp.]